MTFFIGKWAIFDLLHIKALICKNYKKIKKEGDGLEIFSLSNLLEKIRTVYDIYIILIVVFVGLFLLLIDAPQLRKKEFDKEYKLAKYMGYFYLIGGVLGYVAVSIFR